MWTSIRKRYESNVTGVMQNAKFKILGYRIYGHLFRTINNK